MTGGRHVVVLGLMGAGKTSIGRRVASRLDRPLVDGDEILESRNGGRTAATIAEADGIDALHDQEAGIALDALAAPTPAVLAPAASIVERPDVLAVVAEHLVVWLTASADYLAQRAVRKDHRPLLDDGDPVELFRAQLARREPLVGPIADLVIDVESVSKDDAADAVVALVSSASPSSSRPPSSSPPS